jgi:hypothetical protein
MSAAFSVEFQSPNVNDSLLRQLCAEFGDVVNVSVQACYGAMDMVHIEM